MKKTIAILVTLVMMLSLTACGNSAGQTGQGSTGGSQTKQTADKENSTENNTQNDTKNNTNSAQGSTNNEASSPNDAKPAEGGNTGNGENTNGSKGKVLVAYFSATNTTKGVAEHIANGLDAELYEIVPEEIYTDADLNYHDNNSRTTLEMNDSSVRPAISGSVENMEQYDIVFIGYPIWWGDAPRILSTFVESYDFSGKTVVPFCTSGGSGVGSSATNLEKLTSGANWLAGKRLNGGDSQETVMEWVNSLGLDFGE